MCWISLLTIFIIVYIEISLFIEISHVLSILLTLLLAVSTSFVGVSLIHKQGLLFLKQIQTKIIWGENLTNEIIKSISLLLAGLLLLLPGFFTDSLGFLFLFPPIQNLLVLHFLPYFGFQYTSKAKGDTFEGEYYRHDLLHKKLSKDRDDIK